MPVDANRAARAGAKSVSFEAKVLRADGTVEDLGTIAYWHVSRWRRLLRKLGWRP